MAQGDSIFTVISVFLSVALILAIFGTTYSVLAYNKAVDADKAANATPTNPGSGTEADPLPAVITENLEVNNDDEEYPVRLSRFDALEDASGIRFTNGRGTRDDPAQTEKDDRLGGLYFRGTRGPDGTLDVKNMAAIIAVAEEDYSNVDGSTSSSLVFGTNSVNDVGYIRRAKITPAGDFTPYDPDNNAQDIGSSANRWNIIYGNRFLGKYNYGTDPGEENSPYAINTYSYVGDTNEPTAIRLGNLRGDEQENGNGDPLQEDDSIGGVYFVGAYGPSANNATYGSLNHASVRAVAAEDFTSSTNVSTRVIIGVTKTGSSSFVDAIQVNNDGNICPLVTDQQSCGSAANRFSAVFATNGTIQTSDERLKTDFTTPPGLDIVNEVEPFAYKWADIPENELKDKESVRFGHKAQDMKAAMVSRGYDKTSLVNEDGEYMGLTYTETNAILWQAVRELSATVEALKIEVDALKNESLP